MLAVYPETKFRRLFGDSKVESWLFKISVVVEVKRFVVLFVVSIKLFLDDLDY